MSFAALFETSSKVEHSCAPNCMFSTFDSGVLKHTSLRRIEAGERLSVSYSTTVEMPLAERREILLSSKFFLCRCELCRSEVDATAGLQCPKCRGGAVRQSEGPNGAWKCGKCKEAIADASRLAPHEWAHYNTCRRLLRAGESNAFRGIESVVWREQADSGLDDAVFSLAEEEQRRDDGAAAAKLEREFAKRPAFFGGAQEALFCGQQLHREGWTRTARLVLRRYYVYFVAFLGEKNADVRAVEALL
jgi:ribosomal protein L37AE/L43A